MIVIEIMGALRVGDAMMLHHRGDVKCNELRPERPKPQNIIIPIRTLRFVALLIFSMHTENRLKSWMEMNRKCKMEIIKSYILV